MLTTCKLESRLTLISQEKCSCISTRQVQENSDAYTKRLARIQSCLIDVNEEETPTPCERLKSKNYKEQDKNTDLKQRIAKYQPAIINVGHCLNIKYVGCKRLPLLVSV